MAKVVKKVSAPYLIVAASEHPTLLTIGEASTNNALVTINGNLVVQGTQMVVDVVNSAIESNEIILNAGLTATSPPLSAGITVNRGVEANVAIRWNEVNNHWQITNNGSVFENIATQVSGNYLTAVVDDLAPSLGGNLNTGGYQITSNSNVVIAPTGNTQIDSSLHLKEITPPTVISGYGIVHAGLVSSGNTGIYVTHGSANNQELITKKRAMVYAILF